MDRIDAIRARCNAATPGPWVSKNEKISRCVIGGTVELINWVKEKPFYSKSDFDFISNARDDIPYLLAEIDRLKDINEQPIKKN